MATVNRNPDLAADLQNRTTGKELARQVTQAGVVTLTGRVRGRVRYSAARNTPFQGLAADGAALALFALVREGFRVVAFIHDEILVELPDEGGFVSKAAVDRVEQIMVQEMETVLGGLPAAVASTVSTRWSKAAELIVQGDRVLPWSPAGPAAGPQEPATAVPDPSRPPGQVPPAGDRTGDRAAFTGRPAPAAGASGNGCRDDSVLPAEAAAGEAKRRMAE